MIQWFSVVAGLGYIVLGIAIIYYKFFFVPLTDLSVVWILGILMISYGIFRIGRAVIRLKKMKEDE
ncbi:hypothetical protein SAMN05443429_101161 [Cruoricaptor ignavus]|uniref:C4-dicarboxylate ABC transporter n=1 Tax=Cruoricaptor ignavus TaxID=1118202 RepID=A0A1M6A5S3_9FLAO|nr:C4-dicarboxylate ABC transporter [Cruoricaptor ignavus]SHI31831.1 hypothetical protein SAMN05443429_101161 [Cruoricaptor ignavus]